MPRFVIESTELAQEAAEQVLEMAARLFPELAIEPSCRSITEPESLGYVTTVTRWTCQAPSLAHVRRWVTAAGVNVVGVVEDDGFNEVAP